MDHAEDTVLEPAASELVPAFGSDLPEVRIASGSALTLVAQVTNLGTSFIVGVLVARIFGPEGKGALSVILQVPGMLAAILELGIGISIVYFVSRRTLRPNVASANAIAIAAALGLIGAPIIYMLLSGPFAVIPGVPRSAMLIAVTILPLGLVLGWLGSVSVGLGNLKLPMWVAVASSATTLTGLIALVGLDRGSLPGVLGVSVAGMIVGIVVSVVGLRRHILPLRTDVAAARGMARFSMKAHLANISGFLHERQDVLLLGWIAGTAAVGVYSVGVSFAQIAWYVPGALSSAILAKGSRRSDESAIDYTTRTVRVAIIFMIVTVIAGCLVVPFLIPILYGASFASAAYVFVALVPGILADGVTRVLWSFQTTRGRMYWGISVVAMGLNVAAVLALASVWGAVGAALASSVSYSVLALLTLHRFRRDTGVRSSEVLLPRASDVRIVLRTARRMGSSLLRRSPGA